MTDTGRSHNNDNKVNVVHPLQITFIGLLGNAHLCYSLQCRLLFFTGRESRYAISDAAIITSSAFMNMEFTK